MALTADVIYEALETLTVDVSGEAQVIHEGDRIMGADMPAGVPEASVIADGTPPWEVQAAKDALAASRL